MLPLILKNNTAGKSFTFLRTKLCKLYISCLLYVFIKYFYFCDTNCIDDRLLLKAFSEQIFLFIYNSKLLSIIIRWTQFVRYSMNSIIIFLADVSIDIRYFMNCLLYIVLHLSSIYLILNILDQNLLLFYKKKLNSQN